MHYAMQNQDYKLQLKGLSLCHMRVPLLQGAAAVISKTGTDTQTDRQTVSESFPDEQTDAQT